MKREVVAFCSMCILAVAFVTTGLLPLRASLAKNVSSN